MIHMISLLSDEALTLSLLDKQHTCAQEACSIAPWSTNGAWSAVSHTFWLSCCCWEQHSKTNVIRGRNHIVWHAGVPAVNRTITAHAVQARLSLSKTTVDFGSQIVLRSNQVKPPYSLDIVLTSNEATELAWHVGPSSLEGQEGCRGVFTMEPSSGTLAQVTQTYIPKNQMLD